MRAGVVASSIVNINTYQTASARNFPEYLFSDHIYTLTSQTVLPGSFTHGELVLVAQGLAMLVTDVARMLEHTLAVMG